MKPIYYMMFIFSLVAGPWALSGYAQSHDGADFLVDVGEQHLKDGNKQDAIHEFSKALLLEPQNKRAVAHLKKLGIEEGLYHPLKTREKQMTDLAQEVTFYKSKVELVQQQNAQLNDKVANVEKELDHASQSTLLKETEADVLKEKIARLKESTQHLTQDHQKELKALEDHFQSKISGLEKEKVKVVTLHDPAPALKTDDVALTKNNEIRLLRERLNRMVEMSAEYEYRLSQLDHRQDYIRDFLQSQLAHQQKIINVLEEYLALREGSLQDAKDQLVSKEIDLAWTGRTLSDTVVELIDMNNKYEQFLNELD